MAMDCVFDLLDTAAKAYPIKALADEIGKAESTLRNELSRQPGYKHGLHTAYLILKKTGDLRALDEIESMLGRVAFSLPKSKGKITDLMSMTADLTKEFGEHLGAVAVAMKDKRLTPKEAETILKEVTDVIEAGIRIKAYLEKRIRSEP